MKGFRDRLTANGLATTFPLRIEIDAEALRYIVGDVTTVAEWACVTEVFESAGYWVFLAQASPLFAPKRYFADTAAQRAFLAEALGYMSEAARGRSVDAVRLAAG